MAFNAGNAFITVSPDMSKFQDDVKAKIADTPDASILVTADTEKLTADLDEATKGRTTEVTADADTAKAGEALDTLAVERTAAVEADADTTAAGTKLDTLAKPRKTTVNADADTTKATAQLEALTKKSWTVTIKEKIDKVDDKLPGAGVTLAGLGVIGLAPEIAGAAAGLSGLGIAFGAAGADATAFGSIAKPMFADVQTAIKAVTKAQDDYKKADNSADRVKALQAEQQALAKLTPSEKDLYTQLTGLEGAWKKLSQAEQPAVEAAIAPWLKTASDGMSLLKPLITDGASAIETLGEKADAAIKGPFWTTFSTTLGTTGKIAITDFGDAAGKVFDGLAHLFVTFAPDIDKLPGLVDKIATAFDGWAKSVGSKGLDDFLTKTFSPSNIKALADDGKDLATFVENIAKASGDMSPAAFGGLSNVLDIMGHLTPDEILALTGLFLAIKGISAASSAINGISSFISAAKGAAGKITGLFGGAETAAESATEGTAAGDAGGTAAATAFTSTFSEEVTAALPEVFAAIGTEGGTEAGTAGTAWGTAAATAFSTAFGAEDEGGVTAALTAVGTSGATEAGAAGTAWGAAAATAFGVAFGAEDAVGVTAGLTAIGVEGATEAGIAGAAMGSAMAAAFTAAFDTEGVAEIGASLGTASIGATIAAGLIGAALGTALGLGFKLALAATGVSGAVGTIESNVKSAGASANTWLQPAGQQAADGFATGFTSQAAKVQAAAAQAKTWTQAGAAGSSAWIQPNGQQAGAGFATGFGSAHATVNSAAAQVKAWVTSALPSPASWLVNIGVDVVQGLVNGILSAAGSVESAILSLIPAPLRGVVSTVIPGFATGTPSAPAGWAWVGERGPELVHFAGGEQVKTNAASLSMLSGMANAQSLSALSVPSIGGPGSLPGVNSPLRGAPLQLQVSWAGTSDQVTNSLVSGLQFHIQGQYGGDAQAALGQGPVRV